MIKLISLFAFLCSLNAISAEGTVKNNLKRSIASVDSFKCSGTEPFWNINITDGKVMEGTTANFKSRKRTITKTQSSAGSNIGMAYSSKDKNGNTEIALVQATNCSDGMSENTYEYTISFLTVNKNGISEYLSGCCSKQ